MKKSIKMMMTSLFAACTMFSQAAFSVCATNVSDETKINQTYENCIFMAKYLNVDADELYAKSYELHVPTQYVAFVSAINDYSSGSITMSVEYDSNYFSYAGFSNGSHGNVSSYSGGSTSGSMMLCSGIATLGSYVVDPKLSRVIFTHNFTVPAAQAAYVQSDVYSSSPSTHNGVSISSATVNGSTIPTSDYDNYFKKGFKALGDVNNDSSVSQDDVNWILAYLSGSRNLDEEELAVADVTQDGKITVSDAIAVYYLW